jgi:putative endonuclease
MSVWSDLCAATSDLFPARSLGSRGERAAEKYLRRHAHLKITARGYSNHIGEIDLIGIDVRSRPRTVVFVEVKTRTDDRCGLPIEAVDRKKQRQISSTALVYLKQYHLLECRFRFDVVGILWPADSNRPDIRHYPNAFSSTDQWQMFS